MRKDAIKIIPENLAHTRKLVPNHPIVRIAAVNSIISDAPHLWTTTFRNHSARAYSDGTALEGRSLAQVASLIWVELVL